MATKWTKPIVREVDVIVSHLDKERNLIVTLEKDKIVFRPKGMQYRLQVSLFDLYDALDNKALCMNRQCEAIPESVSEFEPTLDIDNGCSSTYDGFSDS